MEELVKEWMRARLVMFDEINCDYKNISKETIVDLGNAECALYQYALKKWNSN